MKIKILYNISFLFISILVSAQDFELKDPDIIALKEKTESKDSSEEITYLYFLENYKPTSEKTKVEKSDYLEDNICSFEQTFENKIRYSVNNCDEEGGNTIQISLPKIEKEKVKKWIEKIYSIKAGEVKNEWYTGKDIYGPVDKGAGCYYEITSKRKNWIITIFCGC